MEAQLALQPEPSVAIMLQSALSHGVTRDNADALGKLMELYERMEDRRAQQAYASAFVALQGDTPKVKAVKEVPNNDGTIRYRYASFEAVMDQVGPLLTKHGFSVSFDTEVGEGRVTSICHMTHSQGHTKPTRYAVRIGSGPPKSSECQADGAAYTYAKRGALCAALNIVVDTDTDGSDDARNLGAKITKEQAEDLRRRVHATDSNEKNFLAYADAPSYEEIHESMFATLDGFLKRREEKKAAETKRPLDKRDADGNFIFDP